MRRGLVLRIVGWSDTLETRCIKAWSGQAIEENRTLHNPNKLRCRGISEMLPICSGEDSAAALEAGFWRQETLGRHCFAVEQTKPELSCSRRAPPTLTGLTGTAYHDFDTFDIIAVQDEWTGEQRLRPADVPEAIEPESIRPMGNYAVEITWPDGFTQVCGVP